MIKIHISSKKEALSSLRCQCQKLKVFVMLIPAAQAGLAASGGAIAARSQIQPKGLRLKKWRSWKDVGGKRIITLLPGTIMTLSRPAANNNNSGDKNRLQSVSVCHFKETLAIKLTTEHHRKVYQQLIHWTTPVTGFFSQSLSRLNQPWQTLTSENMKI